MQTKCKNTIITLAIILLLSINYGEIVRSAGLGVAPAQITMQDRLKGTSSLKSIRLFNSGEQPITFQLSLLGVFACSEVAQLFKAYQFPMEPSKWFNMKDEHVPGEYSFDPLGFSNTSETLSEYKRTELFNSRIAMLAAFGILVQELCTDKTVIDTLVSGM